MIFKPRQKKLNTADLNIKIKNHWLIDKKQSIKFLGVFVDESLNWKEHIRVISGKISRSVAINQTHDFTSPRTFFLNFIFHLFIPICITAMSYGDVPIKQI